MHCYNICYISVCNGCELKADIDCLTYQWRRQDFVTGGEVRYGSIGGLEYEVPQKPTHLLQCIGNLLGLVRYDFYRLAVYLFFHTFITVTHILHNFWTSTHRGEASPSGAATVAYRYQ